MQLERHYDLVYLNAVKMKKMDFGSRSKEEKVDLRTMGIQTSVASHLPFILHQHIHVFHNKMRQCKDMEMVPIFSLVWPLLRFSMSET